ncbi:MAG: NAD(P)H-dependent glycerol-3-phosphate dehydrogenase [Reyranellaceae bacterium]
MAGLAHFAIVGGGAWGTALAMAAIRAGRRAMLWAREAEVVAEINAQHRNTAFLPGMALDPAITAVAALEELVECDALLLVTPAQALRGIAGRLAALVRPEIPVIVCAKGIEARTGLLMSEVAAQAMPGHATAMLSGPTFAEEVARGLPTAITLACPSLSSGEALAQALASPAFRIYWSDDLVGAALGGAVKNVLAIACGIVEGRALGSNARAALLTRGFAEMMRLGLALGARAETLSGLAGLGDLTLTCTSRQSRNMSFGAALGQGGRAAELLASKPQVVEGAYTAAAVVARARALGVEMPICEAVDAVVNGGAEIGATIENLLARPLRGERERR